MKRNQFIKNHIRGITSLIIVMLLMAEITNAQQRPIFNYLSNPVLTQQQQKYADAWTKLDWVKSYEYVIVNENVFEQNYLNLNLPGNVKITVEKREVEQHKDGMYSWKGNIQNPLGNADFVVHGEMITARIATTDFTYLLYPISGGMHILIENNNANMPQDESNEGYQQMLQQGAKDYAEQPQPHVDPEIGLQESLLIGGDCKIRILVAYTDDADANLADPIAYVNSCINTCNTAFDNSSVSYHYELAVSIRVVYTETLNSSTDKTQFRNTADGFIDEIHDYRASFDADLCILITENLQSGICGEAYTVSNSVYANAFCVVTRGCAVGNLSFPHELGHLNGCRHDPYVDGGSTPYAYGHGYVRLASQWRTIMAYNDYCTDNGSSCTRLQYWSNPAITYGGNAMGVAGTNDNESALEASRANISSLETTVTNKVFSTAWSFSSGEQSDVIAGTSVTNNSAISFVFNSGSSGTWRAGTYSDLKPGFWAKSGSKFNAYTDACTTLRMAADDTPVNNSFTTALTNSLQVQPNPFTDNFELIYVMSQSGKVTIELYNAIGEKVRNLMNEDLPLAGPYKFTFTGNDLQPGIYLCVVTANNETKTARIVKAK